MRRRRSRAATCQGASCSNQSPSASTQRCHCAWRIRWSARQAGRQLAPPWARQGIGWACASHATSSTGAAARTEPCASIAISVTPTKAGAAGSKGRRWSRPPCAGKMRIAGLWRLVRHGHENCFDLLSSFSFRGSSVLGQRCGVALRDLACHGAHCAKQTKASRRCTGESTRVIARAAVTLHQIRWLLFPPSLGPPKPPAISISGTTCVRFFV